MSKRELRALPDSDQGCCPDPQPSPLDERQASDLARGFAALAGPARRRLFTLIASQPGTTPADRRALGPSMTDRRPWSAKYRRLGRRLRERGEKGPIWADVAAKEGAPRGLSQQQREAGQIENPTLGPVVLGHVRELVQHAEEAAIRGPCEGVLGHLLELALE